MSFKPTRAMFQARPCFVYPECDLSSGPYNSFPGNVHGRKEGNMEALWRAERVTEDYKENLT